MGKVRTVKLGDEKAEEAARRKAEAKREQKKIAKQGVSGQGSGKNAVEESVKTEAEPVKSSSKSDVERSADILKMMATDQSSVVSSQVSEPVVGKAVKKSKPKKESVSVKSVENPVKSAGKHGKKYEAVRSMVEKNKQYSLGEAIDLVKKSSFSKFDGSVEAHINVSEKGIRGTVQMPHGVGKKVRVAVADDALIEEIATGKINFDVLVAHPSMMPKLARVAKILGPKGLMPNPKTGTIGTEPEEIVKKLSAGQTNWKTEADFPIVHLVLGKVSFEPKKIEENYLVIAKSIGKDKIKSVFLKATMGPSIKVEV